MDTAVAQEPVVEAAVSLEAQETTEAVQEEKVEAITQEQVSTHIHSPVYSTRIACTPVGLQEF